MVSYEEGLVTVRKGLILLGIITLVEVAFALLGNGHIIDGLTLPKWFMYPIMIGFSVYKAYYIVYNFMHMAHEVKGLAMSVLMPMGLLIWAVIAFFQEGSAWGARRALILKKNETPAKTVNKSTGMIDNKTFELKNVN